MRSMKIIFLDNDGVICLANNWGSRKKKKQKWIDKHSYKEVLGEYPVDCRFDNFDPKAIKDLNSILEKTDADIVVSSDWRLHADVDELGDYYQSQGIIKRPIGVTEIIDYKKWEEDGTIPEDFRWSRTESSEQIRAFEITRFLSNYPSVTHWVAIDDLHMGINVENSSYGPYERDWGLRNFVWTPRDWEGIKQSGIKEKILKYLI